MELENKIKSILKGGMILEKQEPRLQVEKVHRVWNLQSQIVTKTLSHKNFKPQEKDRIQQSSK